MGLRPTPGNVDDRKPVPDRCQGLSGPLFGDKGYVAKWLAEALAGQGLRLVTQSKKGMKAVPLTGFEAAILRRRSLVEQGFKRIKRGGWQWRHTRMGDPARGERLWLAFAFATWWLLAVGGEAETDICPATFPAIPGSPRQGARRWPLIGVFRHGWALIMAALFEGRALPLGKGIPEPWPPPPQGPAVTIPMGGE